MSRSSHRRLRAVTAALALCLTLWFPASGAAQERVETLVLRVFKMDHQPAREALPLIDPLLSEVGSVSWQQEDNALVVRDRASVLSKLEPVLREFDHPARSVTLELHLLRASRSDDEEPTFEGEPIPGDLMRELGSMLRLNHYESLGSFRIDVSEGGTVRSAIGLEHEVSFQVGTVLRRRFLKLSGFRVQRHRGTLREQLFHSNVNLQVERAAFITVSRDAASESGLVVAFVWRAPESGGVSPPVAGDH